MDNYRLRRRIAGKLRLTLAGILVAGLFLITAPVTPGKSRQRKLHRKGSVQMKKKPVSKPPSREGFLIEDEAGNQLSAQAADETFNPASAVKLATSLIAIRRLGVDYRFETYVKIRGMFDPQSGILDGDLYISGDDPAFHLEHGIALAQALNVLGVNSVTGNIYVSGGFTMNSEWNALRSADLLLQVLNAATRTTAADAAWQLAHPGAGKSVASVVVHGAARIGTAPSDSSILFVQRSARLHDVLKTMLSYSSNFMAERIGYLVGGPVGVRRSLAAEFAIDAAQVRLASTSGLGVNRVTVRAMMQILRALRAELAAAGLQPSDILPVAGIDPGTLIHRFANAKGSVIGKTGTLITTDGGASALVGQMMTARGNTLLFVIFEQTGNVPSFRLRQEFLVGQAQNLDGGPAPFKYQPFNLAQHLSDIEITPVLPPQKTSRRQEAA